MNTKSSADAIRLSRNTHGGGISSVNQGAPWASSAVFRATKAAAGRSPGFQPLGSQNE